MKIHEQWVSKKSNEFPKTSIFPSPESPPGSQRWPVGHLVTYILFLWDFTFYVYECFARRCVCASHAFKGQKWVQVPLELELQTVQTAFKPRLRKNSQVLNFWTISPAPLLFYLLIFLIYSYVYWSLGKCQQTRMKTSYNDDATILTRVNEKLADWIWMSLTGLCVWTLAAQQVALFRKVLGGSRSLEEVNHWKQTLVFTVRPSFLFSLSAFFFFFSRQGCSV